MVWGVEGRGLYCSIVCDLMNYFITPIHQFVANFDYNNLKLIKILYNKQTTLSSDQFRPDQIRWDQTRSDEIRWDQIRWDQIRWDQIRSDQTRPDQTRPEHRTQNTEHRTQNTETQNKNTEQEHRTRTQNKNTEQIRSENNFLLFFLPETGGVGGGGVLDYFFINSKEPLFYPSMIWFKDLWFYYLIITSQFNRKYLPI